MLSSGSAVLVVIVVVAVILLYFCRILICDQIVNSTATSRLLVATECSAFYFPNRFGLKAQLHRQKEQRFAKPFSCKEAFEGV